VQIAISGEPIHQTNRAVEEASCTSVESVRAEVAVVVAVAAAVAAVATFVELQCVVHHWIAVVAVAAAVGENYH